MNPVRSERRKPSTSTAKRVQASRSCALRTTCVTCSGLSRSGRSLLTRFLSVTNRNTWPSGPWTKYPVPPPGSSKSREEPSRAPAAAARLRILASSGFEPEKVIAATAGSLAGAPNPDTIPNPAIEKGKREGNEKEQEPRARRGRPPEIALASPCDARIHGRRRSGRRQPRQGQHLQPAVRGDVAPPAADPRLR